MFLVVGGAMVTVALAIMAYLLHRLDRSHEHHDRSPPADRRGRPTG